MATQPPPLNYQSVHLASPTVTPPSPQHLQQIAEARQRGKSIQRCAGVAKMSGWTIAIFGGLTVVTSIGSIVGMVLGVGMCVLAWYELRGGEQIRRLNPDAPKHLARNQIILGSLVMLYSAASLWTALTQPSELQQAMKNEAELGSMVGSITQLEHTAYITLYSAMMAAAILGCGGTALYYARQKPKMLAYVHETPPWIVELQRAGMAVY